MIDSKFVKKVLTCYKYPQIRPKYELMKSLPSVGYFNTFGLANYNAVAYLVFEKYKEKSINFSKNCKINSNFLKIFDFKIKNNEMFYYVGNG